jgi:hypothetical protein
MPTDYDTLDQSIVDAWTEWLECKGQQAGRMTESRRFNFPGYMLITVRMHRGMLLYREELYSYDHQDVTMKINSHMHRILYDFIDQTKGYGGFGLNMGASGQLYHLK